MTIIHFLRRPLTILILTAALGGCAAPEVAQTINDPYEEQNRAMHEFNKSVDRAVFKPLSEAMGGGDRPGPVLQTVINVAGNLDLPRMIVNDVLQANPEDAAVNLTRFVINSTFGLAGLFDPATAWGLPVRETDFGETLHVWGVSEGSYVELPLLGPSTSRDTVGRVVDTVLNPLSHVIPSPERAVIPATKLVATLSSRSEYGEAIDDVLYNSADSYAQSRLLYLQYRRFQLGQSVATEEVDPFVLDTEGF